MRARHSVFGIGVALAVALLLAAPLSAQTISGIIAGRVTDATNKPQSSVAITAHNPGTGRDFPASTDEQGYYRILEVPPGAYEVTAELGGFQTETHVNVRVAVGRTTNEEFSLKIKTVETTVRVESTAPMAEFDSATLSSSFPEKKITELPIITRDVNNLALLSPGVLSVRTFSFASTLVPFSVNGSRGRDNNFIIDSVDNNEPLFGGAATQFTNSDIFSEYTILTGQLKAEFGRNSGATVNAITKTGSNNWHGTLFGFGQGNDFNALNQVEKQALLTSPEPFYDTTFGVTLGGPVRKEKSFFFLSYQWDRLSDNLTDVFPVLGNYPASPADLSVLQGLATSPALQAYLAAASVMRVPGQAGTPCFFGGPPPGQMPQLYSRTNPCLLTSTPVTVAPGTTANFNVWNVPNANTFNLRDHQLSGRYDQVINNSNDVFLRYLFDDVASPRFPLNQAGVAAFSDVGLLPDWKTFNRARTQSFLGDHRFQRVNSLNEFRVSYSRVSQAQGTFDVPQNTQTNQSSAIIDDTFSGQAALGPLGGQGGLFPSAGSLITLGTDSSPSRISSNTYQIQDNYSYTYGRHSLKFGVNFVKIDSNVSSVPNDLGFYVYNGQFSGNGFQDFVSNPLAAGFNSNSSVVSQRLIDVRTNAQGQITGFGPNEVKIKEFDQFYFAQDDWRARQNLTFSFGLRYENYGQPINSIHDLNPAAPFVNTDNKDFAPRIGFAYSPAKSWVVRGGYGIAYNPPVLNIPLLIWQSGPVSPLISTDNSGIAQLQPSGAFPSKPLNLADFQQTSSRFNFVGGMPGPGQNVSSGMVQGCSSYFDLYNSQPGPGAGPVAGSRAYNPSAVNAIGTTLPANIPIANCSTQSTVTRNLKNPYQQNWSLGFQKEIGTNYLFELNYVGSKGTRLFQRVDQNPYQGWNTACVNNIASFFGGLGASNLALPGQCRLPRVDNSHGDILEVTNGGSSIYHALQASFSKRYSRNKYVGDATFTMAYTWSHLIDNTSEIFGPGFLTIQPLDFTPSNGFGGIPFLLDPLANSPVESITPLSEVANQTTANERGSSSFDRRHRFVAHFLWEPFPTKNKWLRGWQLNAIYTFQSGQPFSPLNASPLSRCADATGGGYEGSVRPLIGNPSAPKNSVALIDPKSDPFCVVPGPGAPFPGGTAQGPIGYVDLFGNPIDPKTAHFVQMPIGTLPPIAPNPGGKIGPVSLNTTNGLETFSAAGRNILIGPTLNNLDMSLFRNIKVNERFTIQLRWELYDILNHANLGYFNGNPFIADASGASAFAYSNQRTGAAITGGIPENSLDAVDNRCTAGPTNTVCGSTGRKTNATFLSTSTMNTGNRRMQFGLRVIF